MKRIKIIYIDFNFDRWLWKMSSIFYSDDIKLGQRVNHSGFILKILTYVINILEGKWIQIFEVPALSWFEGASVLALLRLWYSLR